MPRVVPLVLLMALLVAGCGSGGDDTSAKEDSASKESPSASPSVTYLVRADTDEINVAAAKAQKAGAAAQNGKRIDACDATTADGYPAWRRCWHGLLDPFRTALLGVSSALGGLSARDFPPACTDALHQGAETFTARAGTVSGLLGGIDSDRRPAQERAMRTYVPSLRKMAKAWAKPFQELTQACYSPEDLESINASPSASPTP